jgi:hypothetical protein
MNSSDLQIQNASTVAKQILHAHSTEKSFLFVECFASSTDFEKNMKLRKAVSENAYIRQCHLFSV